MCQTLFFSQNEDSGKCPYLGNFISKEALSTDGQGNCLLGPITLHPVATVDDEDCDDNHPKLDVKIISVNKDELKIYFSIDGGKTYYNEEDPRIALRVPDADADADGKNSSGGSSSKGGKKGGENDRRRKLVEAKAQLRRKMEGECGYDRGHSCGKGHWWVCGYDLGCYDNKCYKKLGDDSWGEICDADNHFGYEQHYYDVETVYAICTYEYMKCDSYKPKDTENGFTSPHRYCVWAQGM